MIYKIKSYDNQMIQEAYDDAMKKLNDFWGMSWTEKMPDIFIVENRSDINKLKGRETEVWVVGWAAATDSERKSLYLLDFDKLETESDHKKDEAAYRALIAHELSHLFVAEIAKKSPPPGPMWWNEGISTFLSGQIRFKRKPERLEEFLDSSRANPRPAYNEGCFVIELLVNKFGKEKIIEMVKYLGDSTPATTFKEDFKAVFGFDLTYEEINRLYVGI